MKKIISLFLMATACHFSYAQEVRYTSEEFTGISKKLSESKNYYLQLSDKEFVYAAGKLFDDDVTITKLNDRCSPLWTTSEIENLIGIAKYKNNVLVFSEDHERRSDFANSVHVKILSADKGQVISEKSIPVFSDKTLTNFYLLCDSLQNFRYLLMRNTEQEKSKDFTSVKARQPAGYTPDIRVVSFDEAFNLKTTVLNTSQIKNSQFISCASDNSGDIFTASIQDNLLSVSRYKSGESEISATIKASTSFENDVAVYKDGLINIQNNAVFLTCVLDEAKVTGYTAVAGVFNFNVKKAKLNLDLMDKSYVRQYADDYDAGLGDITPIDMSFYNDKIIIIRECITGKRTMDKEGIYFISKPIIVEFYDVNMHKLKELLVNEDARTGFINSSSGYKIYNDKLYLFYNYNKGKIGFHIKYQTIDLDNLSLNKETELDIDPKLNTILFGPGIAWLGNTAVFPFIRQQSMLSANKINTSFKSIVFQ